MYKTINDFLKDYKSESENTLKLLSAIDDKSLDVTVPQCKRTLGKLAWHFVSAIPEMMNQVGLSVAETEPPYPGNAKAIHDKYKEFTNNVLSEIENKWDDSILSKEVNLYGQTFQIADVLVMLVKHEIHHRAQLTVYMRSAGLKVAGMYGPSLEEWASFGLEPQE
jgi:uncharacterized damage-inducible protein DinB